MFKIVVGIGKIAEGSHIVFGNSDVARRRNFFFFHKPIKFVA